MKVNERIRQLRVHKKMTQSELVDGISSIAYLSRIENNQIRPSPKFLKQISAKLGVELDYLVTLDSGKYCDRIDAIVLCCRQTGVLSESDAAFLYMHAAELHDDRTHLRIYATLISHYAGSGSNEVREANKLYEMSRTFLPDAAEGERGEDYFYYFAACGSLFAHLQRFFQSNYYYTQAEQCIRFVRGSDAARLYYDISLVKERIAEDKSICFYYSQKAYEGFKAASDRAMLAKVFVTLGIQSLLVHRYDSSVHYLGQAKEYADETGDVQLLSMIEYNDGLLHQYRRRYGRAIQHYENAAALHNSDSPITDKVRIYTRLVEIHMELKVWRTADRYLDQALLLAEEHELHYDYIKLCAIKAGAFKLYADEIQYEKEMRKAVAQSIEHHQLSHIKPLASELGSHFYEKRAYKKAADYYSVALLYDHKVVEMNQSSDPVREGIIERQDAQIRRLMLQ